jgi:hypothetical protein
MRSAYAAIPARIFGLKHRKARCTVAFREKAMRALQFRSMRICLIAQT